MQWKNIKLNKTILIINLLITNLTLISCQIDPNQIAKQANMHKTLHITKHFILTSYSRNPNYIDKNKPLYIYIEGDGRAWITKYKLSNNPTPTDPLTLKLATIDYHQNVIYIARPCQFTPISLDHNCHPKYWSTARYSQPVIESINEVITNFKNSTNNHNLDIHLIGYSGGATIAGIIATIRTDVKSLTTIAGNLDHDAVSEFHNTTKLNESLNLINFAEKLSRISQIHYVGEYDQIIPIDTIKNFVTKVNSFNQKKNFNKKIIAKYMILKNTDHYNGWINFWKNLSR